MVGKKNKIADYFRAKIVNGDFKPGEELPYRTEIERKFKASSTTVNKVFKELKEQGFINARRKAGTTVSEYPPNQFRYGVVFNQSHESRFPAWSYFFESLDNARYAKDVLVNGIQIDSYYDINSNRSSAGYKKLLKDIENDRIAGLLFSTNPFEVSGTPILTKKGLPRVAFASPGIDMPVIHFQIDEFFDRAMKFLREQGRKKVAVLFYEAISGKTIEHFKTSVQDNNMITRPYWQLFASVHRRENVGSIIRLLLNKNQLELPDAIIIADDHLVEGATETVAQLDIRVPEDLEIVAYSNFPSVPKTKVPVTRIGFDCHDLLVKSIALLDDIKNNRSVKDFTAISPVFESEMISRAKHPPAARRETTFLYS